MAQRLRKNEVVCEKCGAHVNVTDAAPTAACLCGCIELSGGLRDSTVETTTVRNVCGLNVERRSGTDRFGDMRRWIPGCEPSTWLSPPRSGILINAGECRLCGDTVESKDAHDYSGCRCRKFAVDGGSDYLRRVFGTEDDGGGGDASDYFVERSKMASARLAAIPYGPLVTDALRAAGFVHATDTGRRGGGVSLALFCSDDPDPDDAAVAARVAWVVECVADAMAEKEFYYVWPRAERMRRDLVEWSVTVFGPLK
jgi:hypothetical protein